MEGRLLPRSWQECGAARAGPQLTAAAEARPLGPTRHDAGGRRHSPGLVAGPRGSWPSEAPANFFPKSPWRVRDGPVPSSEGRQSSAGGLSERQRGHMLFRGCRRFRGRPCLVSTPSSFLLFPPCGWLITLAGTGLWESGGLRRWRQRVWPDNPSLTWSAGGGPGPGPLLLRGKEEGPVAPVFLPPEWTSRQCGRALVRNVGGVRLQTDGFRPRAPHSATFGV